MTFPTMEPGNAGDGEAGNAYSFRPRTGLGTAACPLLQVSVHQGGRLMLSPPARLGFRNGLIAALFATASWAAVAAAQDVVIQRSVSTVPDFIGYEADRFVVVFKPTLAHQLHSLPAEPSRARANLDAV